MVLENGTGTPSALRYLKGTRNGINTETNDNNKNVRNLLDTETWKLQSAKSLTRNFVPKVMWEPGILTGYRLINQPWSYYVKSLFWIHNETVNVWTHFIAPFLCITLVYGFSKHIDFSRDISAHGLLVFAVTSTISFLSSALAHLFHSKSELIHYIVFSVDHIGISLYGYGYGIMVYYCSGNELFYKTIGHGFQIVHALLALNITLCNIIARTKYKINQCLSRKCVQVISCALSVIFCKVALMFRLYCVDSNGISITSKYHLYQTFFSITNGLLFSLHQPERTYPGRFDIWGHGHQLFHLSAIFCAMCQLAASYEDLLILPRSVLDMAEPNLVKIWGSLATVISLNITILMLFYPKLKNLTKGD